MLYSTTQKMSGVEDNQLTIMKTTNMVEFKIQMERENVKSNTSVLCLNKGDYKGMREGLAKVDWEQKLYGGTLTNSGGLSKRSFTVLSKSIYQ